MQNHNQQKDPIPFIIAILATQVMGVLITQMSPLVVGSVITGLGLTEQQAGLFAFSEFSVLAVTAMAIAPFLHRFSYRSLCWVAAGVSVLAQMGSVIVSDVTLIVLLRCTAGLGEGVIYAVSLASVAAYSKNPDKLYGQIQVMWALLNTILFTAGGYFSDLYAHRGIFLMIASFTILLLIFIRWLPDQRGTKSSMAIDNSGFTASPLLGGILMVGIFIYMIASAGLYTFTDPLGNRAGLDKTEIGYALTIGSAIGFSGAWLAAWLNIRLGRIIPMTAFSVSYAVIAVAMCINNNPTLFIILLTLSIILFYFSAPYLFGLAASLDSKGRWAAAAGSAYLFGFAVGPAFAGSMVEWFGYPGFGYTTALITFVAWLLFMVVLTHLSKSAGTLEVQKVC